MYMINDVHVFHLILRLFFNTFVTLFNTVLIMKIDRIDKYAYQAPQQDKVIICIGLSIVVIWF